MWYTGGATSGQRGPPVRDQARAGGMEGGAAAPKQAAKLGETGLPSHHSWIYYISVHVSGRGFMKTGITGHKAGKSTGGFLLLFCSQYLWLNIHLEG